MSLTERFLISSADRQSIGERDSLLKIPVGGAESEIRGERCILGLCPWSDFGLVILSEVIGGAAPCAVASLSALLLLIEAGDPNSSSSSSTLLLLGDRGEERLLLERCLLLGDLEGDLLVGDVLTGDTGVDLANKGGGGGSDVIGTSGLSAGLHLAGESGTSSEECWPGS